MLLEHVTSELFRTYLNAGGLIGYMFWKFFQWIQVKEQALMWFWTLGCWIWTSTFLIWKLFLIWNLIHVHTPNHLEAWQCCRKQGLTGLKPSMSPGYLWLTTGIPIGKPVSMSTCRSESPGDWNLHKSKLGFQNTEDLWFQLILTS